MEYKTVKYLGVELVVGFEVEGKHYPATRETPEEFPDVIIHEVSALDSSINLINILIEDQVEAIYNLMLE